MKRIFANNSILLMTISLLGILGSAGAQSGLFDRMGIITERGYHGSRPEEYIDLFSGNVILRFLDVYLPGPNGLDVRVWRYYNSKILKDRQSGQAASVQACHKSWVGMGWTMHMGMVHSYSSNNPVIEFPDGRLETAFRDINNSGKYITKEFLKYDKGQFPLYIPKLFFQNGVVWTFGSTATIIRADGTSDPVRLVTRIENAYGHQINIVYDSNSPTIKTITDSMGRIITFVSSGTPKKLSQIKVQLSSVTYRITNYSVGTFTNGYTKLNWVQFPLLPATTFEYENGSSNQYELKKMTTPYGGSISYAYANHVFYFNGIWLDSRVLTQKRIAFNSGEQEKVWNYTYPDYNGVQAGTVHIDGPEYDTDITYHGYDSALPWKTGTIYEYQRGSGSLSETNEWTCEQVSNDSWYILNTNMGPARGLLRASFKREQIGQAPTNIEYLYERPGTRRYGQPTRINYYVNESIVPKHYSTLNYYHEGHQGFADRYLLEHISAKTDWSSSGIKLKEITNHFYEEDNKWGALKKVTKMKTSAASLSWDHTYYGNDPKIVTTTIDPPGSAEKCTLVSRYGVASSETVQEYTKYFRTINSYDSSITKETSNEGKFSKYFYYDVLGSISYIDLPSPKNDITYRWLPNGENKVVVKQGQNTSLENTITYYKDGMGRDLGYTENGDNTTLYYRRKLDAENRLIAENMGSIDQLHEYCYSYNEADDIVQVSDPLGNVLKIGYSEKAKTITDSSNHSTIYEFNHLPGLITTVKDALGHSTSYIYDDIGRLTTVIINGTRTHSYEYDGLDNTLYESHPETGEISYTYDDSNRLSGKVWGGTVVNYVYDKMDRLREMKAGNGTTFDETITYTYGSRLHEYHRVFSSKGWSKDITHDDFGNVTSETITISGLSPKTISYSYDSNNNVSRITYPDGKWSEIASNQLNKPEQLAFNDIGNILVSSASYGPGKVIAGITTSGNGTQYLATYLSTGVLHEASLTRGVATLYRQSYTYDNHGNIVALSSSAPTPTMNASFVYDSLNRLTSAAYSSGSIGSYTYEYDEYGNMKTARENGQTVFDEDYDTNNRIIGSYYDARGNLLSEGAHVYSWDKWNRLEYVTSASGERLGSYMYDDRGLRLKAVPPLPEIKIEVESSVVHDGEEVIFECPIGGSPANKIFVINNEGHANLILSGTPIVNVTGLNADQFSVLQQPTSPILPGASSSFSIQFSPTSPGMKTAAISISNNDIDESAYEITLTGNLEPEMNINEAENGGTWDFGTINIGDFWEDSFSVENLGRATLLLSGTPTVKISGGLNQFIVEQQPEALVPPAGYTYFIIRFSPTREGHFTAELSIANNDIDKNPYIIHLAGTGQSGPATEINSDESALDITIPDGGNELVAGEIQPISWKGGECTRDVRIEYSTDNGSTYRTIVERVANSGLYYWVVPADVSPVCLIRISDPDGNAVTPFMLSYDFNIKMSRPRLASVNDSQFGFLACFPDFKTQASLMANLVFSLDTEMSLEKAALNYGESECENLGLFSSKWCHIRVSLNVDNRSGTLAIDGQTVLENVPLSVVPLRNAKPEIAFYRGQQTTTDLWIDDLEVTFEDRSHAFLIEKDLGIKPIFKDSFDRYNTALTPVQGGWNHIQDTVHDVRGDNAESNKVPRASSELRGLLASSGLKSGTRTENEGLEQSVVGRRTTNTDTALEGQSWKFAKIDEKEHLTYSKSFKFESAAGTILIIKEFTLPENVPYDVSSANFAIVAEATQKLADRENGPLTRDDRIRRNIRKVPRERQGLIRRPTRTSQTSSNMQQDVGRAASKNDAIGEVGLTDFIARSAGYYYLYSYDGKLLSVYDIFGNCLKDYIYFGGRLITEYQPASGQYYYYMPDNIGTTRIVTNSSGTIVYSAAFNPYGGIQQTWLADFIPIHKFVGKERDEETGMDYYGARYYKHFTYRWTTPDPLLAIYEYDPQSLNLYAFTRNNPVGMVDIFGLWTYKGDPTPQQRAAFCSWVEWLKANFPELGAMFGVENDPSDGIIVEFTNIPDKDVMMQIQPEVVPTPDLSSIVAKFTLTVDPEFGIKNSKSLYIIALAHESDHIWNYKLYVDALRLFGNDVVGSAFDLTNKANERMAYMVSVEVAGFMGMKSYNIGVYELMGPHGRFNHRAFDEWAKTQDKMDLRFSGYPYDK